MRLEFNPRGLCYNLYCDTREEYEKLRQTLEKPLTATDIKSIDNMIYTDTDSIKTMKTKLNSEYGRMTMATKEYIVVHDDETDNTIIIFKKYIEAIHKASSGKSWIVTIGGQRIYTSEKYVDVIKRIV